MKRIPLIGLALLMILLSLVGCKDSPNDNPGGEAVVHDAHSKGLSRPFKDGEDTTGITLTVTLGNDIKFKDVNVGDDVIDWFENTLYGMTAKITEVNSGSTAKSTEGNPTSITIGFGGTPKSAPRKISITIPAAKLVGRDKHVGVVVEGQTYTVRFIIIGEGGNEHITQEVSAGKKATKPDTVKLHYLVDEWKDSDGNKFDFDSTITKDLYIQGNGTAVRIVTFEYYDGKPNNEVVVEKGKKVSQPTDSGRNGYNFVGWFLEEAEFNFDSQINKDITLKGKWVNANGKATINWYVGNTKIKSTTVSQGSVITPIAEPNDHKESIADTFKHWTSDPTTKTPFAFNTHKALEDIDLYAVWNELNIYDTFTLHGEYIGTDENLKTNGIELLIMGKRGVYPLPSDYPYKYIAVDKNHDLSFYVKGKDYYDYNSSSYAYPLVYWAETTDVTGGNGERFGDGLTNTQKALALEGKLFNVNGNSSATLWSWFLHFQKNCITEKNRGYWFVPSREELDKLPRNKINNYSTSGNMRFYWTSTETTIQKTRSYVKDTGEYNFVYYHDEGYGELAEYKNAGYPQKADARARLCRVL